MRTKGKGMLVGRNNAVVFRIDIEFIGLPYHYVRYLHTESDVLRF